jgi:pyruvate,water dikinase
MEFIVNNHIKVHPMALLHPEKLDEKTRNQIKTITKGYKDGRSYFIEKLAQGVGTIAAAFYPKKVILRFSDFKTDEYANLLGGKIFEPEEANPMIGWRGGIIKSLYFNILI